MNDSIGLYLNDIGKVPLLTAEDERELSRVIETGREAAEQLEAGKKGAALKRQVREAAKAKDRFIRANLRLVVSVARRCDGGRLKEIVHRRADRYGCQ